MEGAKLLIRAEVADDDLKNQVWNVIKQVDASYSDLHADIIVNSSLTPPAAAPEKASRTYTVQDRDNLSKIAQQLYGKASEYNKIYDANRDQLSDPDHIRASMKIKIPA